MRMNSCNVCGECGNGIGVPCDPACPMYVDLEHEKRQAQYDEYYASTEITIMVPVKVRYHAPTSVVYGFDAPTIDDVEEALRKQREIFF